jgi:hypothetical protein
MTSAPFHEVPSVVETVLTPRTTRFTAGDPGFSEFELGLEALRDAQRFSDEASEISSLLLYRTAVLSLLSARRARSSGAPVAPVPLSQRFHQLERLPELEIPLSNLTGAQLGPIRELLETDGEWPLLAALSLEQRERCKEGLRAIALALAEPLARDSVLVHRELLARRLKRAATVLALLLPLVWFALRKTNLALHRPVTLSSSSSQYGVDPARVVDGRRTNLGFHTEDKGDKSVTIDLGKSFRIRRVDVFNRADCCQDRVVPLELQVGDDQRRFRKVLVRLDQFSLWKAEFPPTDGRYVRLIQTGNAAFHLSEIEVY